MILVIGMTDDVGGRVAPRPPRSGESVRSSCSGLVDDLEWRTDPTVARVFAGLSA